MARPLYRHVALGAAALLAAGAAAGAELKDLHFGEALFEANQGEFFDALVRLDTELAQHYGLDEPALDSLHYHINGAEFSVGDFELNYRMHNRAGRAIRAVLEGNVPEPVRNEAAFRLARIHFQKDQVDEALHALARIDGEVPEDIRDDVEFLRANVHLAGGHPHGSRGAEAPARFRRPRGIRRVQPRHCAAAGWRPGRRDRAARPRRPHQGA
jgi:tetratricopeptide (TPR) repeat protein